MKLAALFALSVLSVSASAGDTLHCNLNGPLGLSTVTLNVNMKANYAQDENGPYYLFVENYSNKDSVSATVYAGENQSAAEEIKVPEFSLTSEGEDEVLDRTLAPSGLRLRCVTYDQGS